MSPLFIVWELWLELDALVVGDGLAVQEHAAAAVAVHVGDEQLVASLLEGGDAQLEEALALLLAQRREVHRLGRTVKHVVRDVLGALQQLLVPGPHRRAPDAVHHPVHVGLGLRVHRAHGAAVLLAEGHAGRHERRGGRDGVEHRRFRDPSRHEVRFSSKSVKKRMEFVRERATVAGRSSEVDGSLDREVAWWEEDAR